jgi:hypothetical protein
MVPLAPDNRLRVELLLLVQLAELHDEWMLDAYEEEAEAEQRSRRRAFETSIPAGLAIGALTTESAEWLRSLDAGFDGPPGPLALNPDARAAMEEVLATGRPQEDDDDALAFAEATAALERVGALSEEDARRLRSGVYGPGDEGWTMELPASDAMLALKAVLPGAPPRNGIAVLSVECYERGITVRTIVERPLAEGWAEDRFGLVRVSLRDDLGTEWTPHGGSCSGFEQGDVVIREAETGFTGGVPSGSRRLTVHVEGESFDFDVTGVAERPAV